MGPTEIVRLAPVGRAWRTGLAAVVLAVLALAAYWVAIPAPFGFDDHASLVENASIRSLWPLWRPLSPPSTGAGVSGRPLVNLSFALNFAVSGDSPPAYRLTNVLLHGATAMLLFGLLHRTLRRLRPERSWQAVAWVFVATWAIHPLVTESVTCIVQRNEVMSGLCYVGMLYAFVRLTEPGASRRWRMVVVGAVLVGVFCKETMVTAPVALLLFDRCFVAGTFAEAWRQRRKLYLLLATTWVVLAVLVIREGGSRGGTVGFGAGISSWHYLLTQCQALALYLKLSIWPHPLVVDYGTAAVTEISTVLVRGGFILGLLVTTVWLLWRHPKIGFLPALFFLLLAPSSSFVPLATQTMAEHRMYLPLVCVVTALGLAATTLWRHGLVLMVLATIPLTWVTVERNRLYRDPVAFWTDTLRHQPDNPRVRINFGNALLELGRQEDAMSEFRRSLDITPGYPFGLLNLGNVYLRTGRTREALTLLQQAAESLPFNPIVRNSFGAALAQADRHVEAIEHYRFALELAPDLTVGHFNLGLSLLAMGDRENAIAHLRRAVQLDPKGSRALQKLEELGVPITPRA